MASSTSPDARESVRQCLECYSACAEMITHFLRLGGRYGEAAHVRLLLDCAEMCRLTAGFLLRESEAGARVCGLCADICDLCGLNCERLGDEAEIRSCAQVCLRCAAQCRKMESASA